MHPVLLSLGPVNVYSYGAMIALGFSIATFLIYKRAETDTSFGMDKDTVFDLAVLILVCGIAGSRILYVAINFPYYAAHPAETINISKGGLVWYGGFVASVVSVIVFTRNNGLSFWSVVDLIAPYLAMAQGFGRVGCFLNG